MQKAQNSTAELLAGKKASVSAGGMKGKNKLGLHPCLPSQLSFIPELIPAGDAPESWVPPFSLLSCESRLLFEFAAVCIQVEKGSDMTCAVGSPPTQVLCGFGTWDAWTGSEIGRVF